MSTNAAPSTAVLQAAANWYLDLQEAPNNTVLLDAHQRWLAADSAHAQAWARLEKLQGKLAILPAGLAQPTLSSASNKRRESLKLLGLLLVAGGVSSLAWQSTTLSSLRADQRTATGERRDVRLDDGSTLQLNSATAVNIDYSKQLREISLLQGEVLVQTAADQQARPFVVHTDQGSIRALGTRFLVRSEGDRSQVQVLQHAVEVRSTRNQPPLRVDAGQQLWFGADKALAVEPLESHADAWVNGMLVVSNWPLPRFIAELARYRSGVLRCDPRLSNLRISGAFQLADTDAILDNLTTTLALRIHRVSRYWVNVEPA
ncbi:FecR domain-containing protein [Pseudomonas sp. M30-35]|uniref:FecR domain-containing protein n=1 Tax=Pseudomonas sp. M30-35 TaxID=1981174 RepID=UPI000B3CD4EE|nr:FecR domain-containing protein [Pseudomonas sp. M30-35]ARU89244.1 iron dicitrate transport regulator FecR [Pseudomonas sp. M30-35]